MGTSLKILIADDHSVIRLAVKTISEKLYTDVLVHEASSMDTVEKRVSEMEYDLIVLDLSMPGTDSARINQFLADKHKKTRILIFSANDEDTYALRYLRAGADGYLDKMASSDQVKSALQLMIKTGRYISPAIQNKLIQESIGTESSSGNFLDRLSDRELEVARLLSNGKTNQEICHLLSIHSSTVSTLKKRIFKKLDISNIIELKEFLS